LTYRSGPEPRVWTANVSGPAQTGLMIATASTSVTTPEPKKTAARARQVGAERSR
jgi:hypothetical protein